MRMKNKEIILFAVVGKSPAVITETIWALVHSRPAVIPHRVVVLTTSTGAAAVRKELFAPSPACNGQPVWDALRAALARFNLNGRLCFGETSDDIRVFTAPDGPHGRSRELDDIRTASESNAVANFILEKLRAFADVPDNQIIASIAGGRKTMSALLYACMSLVGREGDRITHVLVREPFDDPRLTPRFYFPDQEHQRLRTPEGELILAENARIELADLPFVPLRNRFREAAEMPGGFLQTVQRFSRNFADIKPAVPVKLRFDVESRQALINNIAVKLRPRALLTLMFLAEINRRPPLPASQSDAVDLLKGFLARHSHPYSQNWVKNVTVEDLKREISTIRQALRAAGVAWMPGSRADSLKLPPYHLVKSKN